MAQGGGTALALRPPDHARAKPAGSRAQAASKDGGACSSKGEGPGEPAVAVAVAVPTLACSSKGEGPGGPACSQAQAADKDGGDRASSAGHNGPAVAVAVAAPTAGCSSAGHGGPAGCQPQPASRDCQARSSSEGSGEPAGSQPQAAGCSDDGGCSSSERHGGGLPARGSDGHGGARAGRVCATCGGPPLAGAKLKACGRCRSVWYCSPECQKQHWGEGGHKQACLPKDRDVKQG